MNILGVEEGRMLFDGTSGKTYKHIVMLLDFSKNTSFPSQLICITSVTFFCQIYHFQVIFNLATTRDMKNEESLFSPLPALKKMR